MSMVLKMPPEPERTPQRRRLKSIPVLPTLMTLGNLLCGFSAIHFGLRAMYAAGAEIDSSVEATLDSKLLERMLPSFIAIGAMLVLLGMLFDMLDGLAARLTKKTSEFGAQIDSLADVVTFGVAPGILVVALMMREWHSELTVAPLSIHPIGRAIWVCSAAYCICGAVRLARFNVEQGRADFNHRTFRGLPVPGAAAVIATLVMLHEHVGESFGSAMLYALPAVMLGTAFLMISRVRYERITQVYLVKRRPFEHMIAFVVVLVVLWSYPAQTLAVLCCSYAMSGPVITLVKRLRAPLANSSSDADTDEKSAVDKQSRRA